MLEAKRKQLHFLKTQGLCNIYQFCYHFLTGINDTKSAKTPIYP